jgi:hypothetical protein
LLKDTNRKDAVYLPGRKRDREDGLDDEHSAVSKKAKDERRIHLKRLIALVDEAYPKPSQLFDFY